MGMHNKGTVAHIFSSFVDTFHGDILGISHFDAHFPKFFSFDWLGLSVVKSEGKM